MERLKTQVATFLNYNKGSTTKWDRNPLSPVRNTLLGEDIVSTFGESQRGLKGDP